MRRTNLPTIQELEGEIKREFGRVDLKNEWVVYEYLKNYCGIKEIPKTEQEYRGNIRNINNAMNNAEKW